MLKRKSAMRGYQEQKGQRTRLGYDRQRAEFVTKAEPHPFVVRNAASEVQIEAKEPTGRLGIGEASRLPARSGTVPSLTTPARPLTPSNIELTTEQNPSRDEPLAGYEDRVWRHAVVGLALAGIVIWAGFVVS